MKNWFGRKETVSLLSPLEGYNLWADSYGTESNPIKDLSDNFIDNNLPDLAAKTFLDAGCGAGKYCAVAEKNNAREIAGIDLSPAMVEIARKNCPQSMIRCGDLSAIDVEKEKFDVVLCALVLGHIENIQPALDRLLDALKPGGVMVLTDFHPFLTLQQSKRTFQRDGKTFEVRHHLHLFETYFRILKTHNVTVESLAEPVFRDQPVVFGMVARKLAV